MSNDTETLTCLVADDEPYVRNRICRLAEEAGLQVVSSAANGTDALAMIHECRPAIAFLDIQMPGLSGFEVVQQVSAMSQPPVIIFITAHSEHALAAFELSAIDYVMKPVEAARFAMAAERAKTIVRASEANDALTRLKGALQFNSPQKLTFRSGSRRISVSPSEVIRFQSVDDYVEAWLASSSHLLDVRMAALQNVLSRPFVRIHRSHIVNMDHVRASSATNPMILEMSDGTSVPVSRSYNKEVRRILGSNRMIGF